MGDLPGLNSGNKSGVKKALGQLTQGLCRDLKFFYWLIRIL